MNHPFSAKTYGSDKTPAPIAEHEKAVILADIEPFSNLNGFLLLKLVLVETSILDDSFSEF